MATIKKPTLTTPKLAEIGKEKKTVEDYMKERADRLAGRKTTTDNTTGGRNAAAPGKTTVTTDKLADLGKERKTVEDYMADYRRRTSSAQKPTDPIRRLAEQTAAEEMRAEAAKARVTDREGGGIEARPYQYSEALKRMNRGVTAIEKDLGPEKYGQYLLDRAAQVTAEAEELTRTKGQTPLMSMLSESPDRPTTVDTKTGALPMINRNFAEMLSGEKETVKPYSATPDRDTYVQTRADRLREFADEYRAQYAARATNMPDFEKVAAQEGPDTKVKHTAEEAEKLRKERLNKQAVSGAGILNPSADNEQELIDQWVTDKEVKTYNYLVNSGMKDIADVYWEKVMAEAQNRRIGKVQDFVSTAPDGFLEDALGSALSIGYNMSNEAAGGMYTLDQGIRSALGDEEANINPYHPAFFGGAARDALREDVMKDMGEVGRFIYQSGMSMGDTLANAAVFGSALAPVMMGSGAMADTAKNAKLSGATDEQALKLGIVAGGAELVSEKIGFDQLGKLIGGTKGNVFRAVLGHMASEFGEESATEAANLLADYLVMQDRSEYERLVAQYGGGEEGVRRAWMDMLGQIGLSGLGGALSGAVMGGGSAVIGKVYQEMELRRGGRAMDKALAQIAEQAAQNGETVKAPADVSELALQTADNLIAEEKAAAQGGAQEATQRPAQLPRTGTAVQTAETQTTETQTAETQTADRPHVAPERTESQPVQSAAAESLNDGQKQRFMTAAEKYGDKALVFAHNYEGGDVETYDKAFNALYTAGRVGLTLDRVGSVTDALTEGMSETAKRAIWQAGQNSVMTEVRPGAQKMYTTKATYVQKRQIAMLNEIGRKYGVEIDIVDSIRVGDRQTANGAYSGGRKIVVALDAAEGAILQTGVHELTHYLKRTDDAGYQVLKNVVMDHLQKSDTFILDAVIRERRAQYAGQNLTDEEIIEEIVAEAVPTFLTDRQAVREFVNGNRPLAKKIRDFFVKFAEEIREIASRYMQRDGAERDEIANLLGRSDALTEIARTFDAALESAEVKTDAEQGETVYARGRKYDPDRERALKPGEMRNEFYEAMSVKEWNEYFQTLNGELYNPDYYVSGARATMVHGDKLLFMRMRKNGEFTVVAVYRSTDGWYNDNIDYILGKWRRDSYGLDYVKAWLETFATDDGSGIFEAYDRHSRRFVRMYGKENSTGRGTAGVSGGRDAYGEGLRETSFGQAGAVFSEVEREAVEFSDVKTSFSLRTEDPPKKTMKGYKVFVAFANKPGELYPPMVANPGGESTPVGVWLNADEGVTAKDKEGKELTNTLGRKQVKAGGKGTQGGSGALAYRPGWHLGEVPMAKQFARLNPETGEKDLFPENFIWAECEFAADVDYQEEAMSYGYNKNGKFQHSLAGLPKLPRDGYYTYRTNPDPTTVPWFITGAMKVTRILSDEETDAILRANGVEPMKRKGGPIDLAKYGFTAGDISGDLTETQTRLIESNKPVNGVIEAQFSLSSPAFRNWFGESKIVNEDGSPKVMYHGSAASFTAFDKKKARSSGLYGRGFYFTDSDSHAGQYGSLYQVYLKVEKPLTPGGSTVTRAQVKKFLEAVAENEDDYSIENYGTYDVGEILKKVYQKDAFALIQNINATAIGDFVEAVKLFNDVNGTKYDGIVVPTETVVFEPTQIKSATDNIGTYDPNNPDIRFSLNTTSPATSLMDENQNLSLPVDVDVDRNGIRKLALEAVEAGFDTGLNERMQARIRGIANKIMKETGSGYSKADFIENVTRLVEEYAKSGWTEDTLRAVTEMSKKIIETSERADNSLREQYADVRKRLREAGVALTDTQKQEAANLSGGYGEYRKSVFGTVNLKDEGMTLESLWDELSGEHPEIFTPGAVEGDQVRILQEFAYLMRPKYENPYGMDMDGAALEMAMRIEGDVMGIIGARDAAKSMYGSAEKLRSRFEAEYREKLKQQKAARVQKFQQIAADLKAAKAKGDSAEQAKIMGRYRAAMKSTGLDEAYAEIWATLKAREEQKAENAKTREMRGKVTRQASELMNMLAKPKKGRRIPTGLQDMVLGALEMLDINGAKADAAGRETVNAKAFRERLNSIRAFYEEVWQKQSAGEVPEGMDGLMMTFSERNLQIMKDALDVLGGKDNKYRLRDMNIDQLRSLGELLDNIRHTVDSIGKLWRIQRYQSVAELGNASIAEMDARGPEKLEQIKNAGVRKAAKAGRDFLALDMMEPVSYGERLGEGGGAIIQGLMDGEKEKFGKVREAAAATMQMIKDAGVSGYDIGKWKTHVQTVQFGNGAKVRMTDAMIMSLYLTAQRPQGRQHLLGVGLVIPEGLEVPAHKGAIPLSEDDLRMIADKLTDKQRRMADAMQAYLSTDVAKWGNDVTQRLYLYDAFTEDKYWPLTSDPNALKTQEPEGDRAFDAILNAGFTKPLNERANNQVVITDAFDVFGRHIGEMASYAGYAEVMTDTLAWLNYRQRDENGPTGKSIKLSIDNLLGSGGVKYLTKLVQDINGARRGGDNLRLDGFVGKTRKAAVAGKIRVAMQQPTSIVRAAAEINPIYLLRAMKPTWGSVKEMQKYSSLAWWKSNGNYEIGIGKSTDEMLWGDTSKWDTAERIGTRAITLGLDPGKLDDLTWSRIWEAAKLETKRRRRDLKVGSEEYFKAVAERFEAICDRTQVVDTVMHRSDIMRRKDGTARTLTAFMGEPIKSYNMLMRSIMEAGRNPKDAKAWRKLAGTGVAYVASVAATAAATALFDALKYRDDDDPIWEYLLNGGFAEDWAQQWLKSFKSNINPAGNIVLVKDIVAIFKGEDVPTVAALEGVKSVADAVRTWTNFFGEDNSDKRTWYGLIKPAATAIANVTGLPLTGLMANAEMLAHAFDPKILQTKSDMQTMGEAYDKLYKAMAEGNRKEELAIRTEIARGLYGNDAKNPKEIDTGVAEALAWNDERILKAWQLRQDGRISDLTALYKTIQKDGFTDEVVKKAANRVEGLMNTKYREALEEGDTAQAEAIRAKAAKYGMVLTQKEEKDMDEELEAKTIEYKQLFEAIRGGDDEDIAAAAEIMEAESDAEDPAKAVRGQVSGEFREEYVDMVRSGRTAEAEKLGKTLDMFDLDEEDRLEWVKDDYRKDLKQAVRDGDHGTAEEIIETLKDEYELDDESLAQSLTSEFKQEYIDLVMAGKDREADALAEKLQDLGLKYADGNNRFKQANLNKWVRDWEKAQEE